MAQRPPEPEGAGQGGRRGKLSAGGCWPETQDWSGRTPPLPQGPVLSLIFPARQDHSGGLSLSDELSAISQNDDSKLVTVFPSGIWRVR